MNSWGIRVICDNDFLTFFLVFGVLHVPFNLLLKRLQNPTFCSLGAGFGPEKS
jgi:hypothetical protein